MFTLQPLTLKIGLISILVLPTLLQDIANRADKWGNDGKTSRVDPFTEIYNVSLAGTYVSWDSC